MYLTANCFTKNPRILAVVGNAVLTLVLTSLLPNCGSSGDSVTTAYAVLAQSQCARRQACSNTVYPDGVFIMNTYGDMPTCLARQELACVNNATAPGTGTSAGQLEKCASEYVSWACTDLFDGNANPPPDCAPPGTLANGQSCTMAGQCASRFCSGIKNSSCGVLRRRAARRRLVRHVGMRAGSGVQGRIHRRHALPGSACSGRRDLHIGCRLPGVFKLCWRQRCRCYEDRDLHRHGFFLGRLLWRHRPGVRRQSRTCVLGGKRRQDLPASRVRPRPGCLRNTCRWFACRMHRRRLLHGHGARRGHRHQRHLCCEVRRGRRM